MHFIFDLHRTLISVRTSHGQFLASKIVNIDPQAFDGEFARRVKELDQANDNTIWLLNGVSSSTSRMKWSELLVNTALSIGVDIDEDKLLVFCEASYDRLSDPLEWFCFPGVHDALTKLVANDHTISILSNFDYRGEAIVNTLLASHPWRKVDLSFQTGLLKPEKGAFLSHCRCLGVLPAQALMVGDDAFQDGTSESIGISFKKVSHPDITLASVLFENE